jgi:hypothetical protein
LGVVGKAKVHQYRTPLLSNHDVIRLEISMKNLRSMKHLQSPCNLQEMRPEVPLLPPPKLPSLQEFHHNKWAPLHQTMVEDFHHIGVAKRSHESGLSLHPSQYLGTRFPPEPLDGDFPVEFLIPNPKNHPHASLTKQTKDLKAIRETLWNSKLVGVSHSFPSPDLSIRGSSSA